MIDWLTEVIFAGYDHNRISKRNQIIRIYIIQNFKKFFLSCNFKLQKKEDQKSNNFCFHFEI